MRTADAMVVRFVGKIPLWENRHNFCGVSVAVLYANPLSAETRFPSKLNSALSLLFLLTTWRAVLSLDFLPSSLTTTTPVLAVAAISLLASASSVGWYRTHGTYNIYYAINELRQLRHGWGGRHQSQGMHVMYACQILQSYVPCANGIIGQSTKTHANKVLPSYMMRLSSRTIRILKLRGQTSS